MNEQNDNELSLKLQKADYATSALKSALGAIPFAGSLLSEIAGTVIPNQRIERIVKFAEVLGKKLDKLEQDFVKSQLKNETFSDLLEEGLRQASRSLSDERRAYIASLISNSLSSKDIEYQESKHLLRILDEINDVEIIWLRYFLSPKSSNRDNDFRNKHKQILTPVSRVVVGAQSVNDKGTIQDSYKEHLAQLGLLEKIYGIQLDSKRGGLAPKGSQITSLGRMLLREIGLTTEEHS